MAYGLRTYDSSGNLFIDVSDRLTRYVTSVYVSVGSRGSTFVSVSGMSGDGTWAIIGVANYLAITYGSNGFTVNNQSTSSTVSATLHIFRV
jgi:hypothetical protein